MVYKPRLVAVWGSRVLNSEKFLYWWGPAARFAFGECRGACATGHVVYHCRDQPRHSSCLCEFPYSASWTWIDHAISHSISLTMHGLPTSEQALWRSLGPCQWPWSYHDSSCWLQVCCMSLRQQPCMQQVEQGLAHSHSRVQAERPWCRWRRGRRGLAFSRRSNLTCYITWVKSTKMLNSYLAVI